MRTKTLFFLLLASFLFHAHSYAYEGKGHRAIERKAYSIVTAMPAAGGFPSGSAMIQELISGRIMATDFPTPRSDRPDYATERQFAQSRQGYHFMAAAKDVITASAERDPASEKRKLMMLGLPPNFELMYGLYREILVNGKGSRQAGRGIYVLMHIIADSYSKEHTQRERSTTNIITVKGWQAAKFSFPPDAKAREDDGTMRLLHTNSGEEDKNWGTSEALTPLADSAAHAIADLIVKLYQALREPSAADRYFRIFMETHFQPVGATPADGWFTSASGEKIQYSFSTEYATNPKEFVFSFDRFPQYYLVGKAGTAFKTDPLIGTYGFEFGFLRVPTSADRSGALLSRIPWGYGLSAEHIDFPGKLDSYADAVRTKAFLMFNFSLPIINATIQPSSGVALSPFASKTNIGYTGEVDAVWNIGRDWFLGRTNAATRFSLGYQYDGAGFVSKGMFVAKIGFNTWHARIIKSPQ